VRYIRTIKNWLQDRVSLIVILISVGIGIGIGMAIYETIKQSLVNTGAIITWIGAIVGLAGMFRIYFKEKSEEKKTPKLAFGEAYKRDDNSYFIDVGLISGHGRAQRCVGYITVEYSDIDNSSTVWEHSALREYDIGSHMGLRLFKVENNSILFPAALGHMISGFAENPRPLDVFRNKQIKIEVNFINGPKPEPYIDRLSNIVDNAPLR
jgi:uncharacterized membrane protein YuzA (DUF378 family)